MLHCTALHLRANLWEPHAINCLPNPNHYGFPVFEARCLLIVCHRAEYPHLLAFVVGCPKDDWTLVHVWALGQIGTLEQPYSSDFEGSAASLGDAHYTSFSLNMAETGQEPYDVKVAHYLGGSLTMDGGRIGFGGIVFVRHCQCQYAARTL